MSRNQWLAAKAVEARKLGDPKSVKRAPLPKHKPLTTGHCQLCGREIGTTNGVIAHHGYTRPGQGWGQTASCFGARWREYEVAHDALDEAIVQQKRYIEIRNAAYEEFVKNPPAKLTWKEDGKYNFNTRRYDQVEVTAERPDGFDPLDLPDSRYGDPDKYVRHYRSKKASIWADISHAVSTLKYLEQRRAEWKEPK